MAYAPSNNVGWFSRNGAREWVTSALYCWRPIPNEYLAVTQTEPRADRTASDSDIQLQCEPMEKRLYDRKAISAQRRAAATAHTARKPQSHAPTEPQQQTRSERPKSSILLAISRPIRFFVGNERKKCPASSVSRTARVVSAFSVASYRRSKVINYN